MTNESSPSDDKPEALSNKEVRARIVNPLQVPPLSPEDLFLLQQKVSLFIEEAENLYAVLVNAGNAGTVERLAVYSMAQDAYTQVLSMLSNKAYQLSLLNEVFSARVEGTDAFAGVIPMGTHRNIMPIDALARNRIKSISIKKSREQSEKVAPSEPVDPTTSSGMSLSGFQFKLTENTDEQDIHEQDTPQPDGALDPGAAGDDGDGPGLRVSDLDSDRQPPGDLCDPDPSVRDSGATLPPGGGDQEISD